MVAAHRLLASMGLSVAAGLVAAAPLAPRTTCYSGVYMIVARGSDEPAGEGAPGAVADDVAAQLPDSASIAVDYPASIADPPYPDSVTDGINDLISKVQAYVDACGSASKLALIGYSQGGNVITDALAGGVDKPTPLDSSYTQYITAVTVFGDPTFTANQTFDVGTSTTNGIFSRGGSSLAALNDYASILQSYCNAGDEFCASGDDSSVHGEEVSDYASAATDFIVSMSS